MPRKQTTPEKIAREIPHGSSCLGCKFLGIAEGESQTGCSLLGTLIKDEKKECGINESKGK